MKKREILKISAAAVLLWGCTAAPAEEQKELIKYSNLSYDAGFDTVYAYTEYGTDEEAMKENFETGTGMFSQCNALFDIYNSYEGVSGLKEINDNAGKAPVEVDPVLIGMLKEAKNFSELTDGAFDITIGSILKVWHNYREEGIEENAAGRPGKVPSMEELQEAAAHTGWSHVTIDEEKNTVYLDDPEMSLDAGGIAKGYAAEMIGQALDDRVSSYASINAGRNIRTVHTKADGSDWRIGIVDPETGSSLLVISKPGSCSFVTSGDYERFYEGEDGTRYHHIIDPSTLMPAAYYRSVTIITEDSSAADCLSTALFCLSVEEGRAVLQKYEQQSGHTADAVWIMAKDKTQDTEGKDTDRYHIAYTEGLEGRITWSS